MTLVYQSTRDENNKVTASQAILQGLATDGGLFTPLSTPEVTLDFDQLKDASYQEVAKLVLSAFLDDFTEEELDYCITNAYDDKFDTAAIAPVVKLKNHYNLELFHGSTIAFKDMALSILPYLLTTSAKKQGVDNKIVILTATSGDTGKAAMAGFADVPGTEIIVFYPKDGVSKIQELQMTTQTGANTHVIAIDGNFDDAQSAVKVAFGDKMLKEVSDQHHVFLSSANSINVGRLIPQIVYYFHSYFELVRNKEIEMGDQVNFCVPSGNFGNCLAGWFAKNMGLPVNKFITASNKNNILTDFFTTGKYDANREFFKTNAPAMDILVSSNLERLVWYMSGKDGDKVKEYMEKLKADGIYEVDDETFARIQDQFKAGYLNEEEVLKTIKDCYEDNGYVLDTHTACGYGVLKQYQKETGDQTNTILLSTASPYKFPESVYKALFNEELDVYDAIEKLNEKTGVAVPKPLVGIKDREVLHKTHIDKTEIINFIKSEMEGL